ncbi:MAG: right-handed parallel beta-helix repeat-containing protein [Lewinellaceae bacterium]|nr:right-handed parallel beta-helix repeat-containing protein [Lewinellaceae bacterium]
MRPLSILYCCLSAFNLSATNLHVGTGQAYNSILSALAKAQSGDTIFVHEGTYAEGNLAIDKRLIFIGIGYPVLDGQHNCEIITVTASDVYIKGFEIRNSGQLSTLDVANSEIRYNNSEQNLRYGLHFMFSHNDHYHHNRFHHNGAGVAVMYSRQVQMMENEFGYNWGGSAYGLLLKDISDSHIWKNIFEHNSAAVYMEGASRITLEQNQFRENGWALRVQASCDANVIRQNNFFGNSFDVSTNGSLVLNTFDGNYWDRYEGYDLNRDGVGDVPFRPVSLYAVVVEKMPYGLLLMRSFMVYLMDKAEKIIPSLTPEQLMDQKPTMKPLEL